MPYGVVFLSLHSHALTACGHTDSIMRTYHVQHPATHSLYVMTQSAHVSEVCMHAMSIPTTSVRQLSGAWLASSADNHQYLQHTCGDILLRLGCCMQD